MTRRPRSSPRAGPFHFGAQLLPLRQELPLGSSGRALNFLENPRHGDCIGSAEAEARMTTISTATYTPYVPTTPTPSPKNTTSATSSGTGSGSQSATNVTLSDAAKAALALPDFTTVVADARAALDKLFADGTKPADADLSKLDRRQLFAVASNAEAKFTSDEQAAAKAEQQTRLDAALSGPLAVARVTDDIEGIYTTALAWLDGASTEEKATPAWTAQRAALLDAQKQLAAEPSKTPAVDGDIVADYIQRATAGDTGTLRAFDAVAGDVRAALDKQYADAKAAGKPLVFSSVQKGQPVDFSQFDSRSLSAIVLDQGNKFSAEEVFAAKQEMQRRSGATLLAGLKNASSSDPAAFAKNLISAYGSMSPEERSAAGWSDKLYAAAVASYNTASQLANIFGDSSGVSGSSSALSILDYMDGSDGQDNTDSSNMSLASILSQ
jgi:hypothetical protein